MGYASETLKHFEALVSGPEWRLADPPVNAKGLLELVHERTGLTFVLLPSGSFRMGSEDGDSDEGPVHEVKVGAFLLCKTECTQRAWDRVGGEDDRRWKGSDLPMEGVSWTAANAWCEKAGLRLPSESEWEYACRAGTETAFSTGGTITTAQANYDGRYPYGGGPKGEYRGRTVEAGSLPANPWGLHEMHGNVWEWCEDRWHGSYAGAPTDGSAWTTGGSGFRVVRGGSWFSSARYCRSAIRSGGHPGFRGFHLGFRPASKGLGD